MSKDKYKPPQLVDYVAEPENPDLAHPFKDSTIYAVGFAKVPGSKYYQAYSITLVDNQVVKVEMQDAPDVRQVAEGFAKQEFAIKLLDF